MYLFIYLLLRRLPMEGQKALRFHQKDLHLCSEDERKAYRFEMIWGWVTNDRIFIFGWTSLLRVCRERLAWSPLIKVNYVNVVLFPFSLVLIGGAGEGPEIKRKEVALGEEAAQRRFAIVYLFVLELGAGSLSCGLYSFSLCCWAPRLSFFG